MKGQIPFLGATFCESCKDHTLEWFPDSKYQYCSNCQSVKAYDDVPPTVSGIDDSVVFDSWVKFKANDAGQGSSKDITHNYKVGNEARSVLFKSVPYTGTGISKVTVSTYSYDADQKVYSILEEEETLTEIENDNGKKSYQFRGANGKTEYLNYQNAQTSEQKRAALKAQRITVEHGDMLEHIDKDNDHKCDICNKILSKCIDNNKEHKCDICNNTLSKCVDANKDHKCDICGKILTTHFGGTPTCTDKAVCLICGKGYGEMNPNNHPNLQHVDAKAAAVDTEGNIEYWYCKDCNKYFADKDGNKEISKADTVIAGLTKTDDNAQSPKTGDNGNMALWLALLLFSSSTVVVTTVISKKKKHNQ